MSSSRFVPILPDAVADAVDGLSFDAAAVYRGLLELVDWRTATWRGSLTELAGAFATSRKRLTSAMSELDETGRTTSHFARGHGGEVVVLGYFDVIHLDEAERRVRKEDLLARVGEHQRDAARVGEHQRDEEAPLASESTSARVGEHLVRVGEPVPSAERRERPAETSLEVEEQEGEEEASASLLYAHAASLVTVAPEETEALVDELLTKHGTAVVARALEDLLEASPRARYRYTSELGRALGEHLRSPAARADAGRQKAVTLAHNWAELYDDEEAFRAAAAANLGVPEDAADVDAAVAAWLELRPPRPLVEGAA